MIVDVEFSDNGHYVIVKAQTWCFRLQPLPVQVLLTQGQHSLTFHRDLCKTRSGCVRFVAPKLHFRIRVKLVSSLATVLVEKTSPRSVLMKYSVAVLPLATIEHGDVLDVENLHHSKPVGEFTGICASRPGDDLKPVPGILEVTVLLFVGARTQTAEIFTISVLSELFANLKFAVVISPCLLYTSDAADE